MKLSLRFPSLCAALSVFYPFLLQAEVTDPVGAVAKTLVGGGKFNLISKPFVNSVEFQGAPVSVSGTSVEIPDASGLVLPLYLEVETGPIAGYISVIESISNNTLILNDDLSSQLTVDDIIIVRKLDTISSIFGADNTYGLKASPSGDPDADQPDIVYLLNAEAKSTNTFFYTTLAGYEGWYNTATLLPSDDIPIYPDTGMMILVRGPDVEMVLHGMVQQGEVVASVFPGFNNLGVMNPVSEAGSSHAITLANSGLFTGDISTGIAASPDGTIGDADILYLVDPTGGTSTYFYTTLAENEGWYNTATLTPADDIVLETGTSFFLKRNIEEPFSWSQAYNY